MVSVIAAGITLVFFSIYVGTQLITFGKLFSNLFGINMITMVIIGAVIVLFYTLLGGRRN